MRGLQEGPGQPIWAAVGDGSGGWAVCRDGAIVRSRWGRLSCIDAQVIAAELQRAYALGMADMALATVFAESLGDEEGENTNTPRCSNCNDVMVCKCLYCDNDI